MGEGDSATVRTGKPHDLVNSPSWYNSHPSGIECIDIVKHHDFNIGSVFKYCWRAGLKREEGLDEKQVVLKDLMKARYYLNLEIEMLGGVLKSPEVLAAEASIVRLRERAENPLLTVMAEVFTAKQHDIETATEELRSRGIDPTLPADMVIHVGMLVVHRSGFEGTVVELYNDSAYGPGALVEWSKTQPINTTGKPDYGKPVSRCMLSDLAIPASPVPVELTPASIVIPHEEAPSRAVPLHEVNEILDDDDDIPDSNPELRGELGY